MNEEQEKEQWTPLGKAAKEVGVSHSKLSRMASRFIIKSKRDPRDDRVILVDLVELRKLFES